MDTRRLNCLLLGDGRVVELTVHDRETRVAELEEELRRQLVRRQGAAAAAAVAFELFVARVGDSFLAADSRDAQHLAFCDRDSERNPVDHVDFLTPANAMTREDAVHDHFPVQPPCVDGAFSLLHVLARMRRRNHHENNHTVKASPPVVGHALCDEEGGAVARLIASARLTRVDPVAAGATGHGGVTTTVTVSDPRGSLVLRCASPRGVLWLSEDADAKATLFAPPSWRVLAAEIFRWLQLDREARTRGRRAVVVGAPRAGKSAFLGFLLLQLLWLRPPRPVCVMDVPGVAFARVGADRAVLEGTRGEHFARELQDPQTLYLFDAAVSRGVGPLRPRDVRARSIVVAPHLPYAAHGAMGKRMRAFVLPRWSLAEVRVCRQLCADGEGQRGLASLYSKWGGVPGRLCAGDLAASEATLERALARLTPEHVVATLVTLERTRCGWNEVATGRDSARWRPLAVAVAAALEEDDEEEADGQRFVYTGQVAFTSQYVCDRVLARVPLRTWTIRARAAPPLAATPPAMWTQLHTSLAYLEGEEEEKHEAPPPAVRTPSPVGSERSRDPARQ